jgi:acetolactate synthase-1/2/3 large subunit
MLTCGELLVRLLEDLGVRVVFGIPGVHTVELYRGLPATQIRHITPRHEQGAGFMADGYARVSGSPGVCFIITGPGMTNIMTAMGQAYADSIPMLVISSVNKTEQLGMGGGRLHELPSQRNLVSGVSAFSHTLMRPDELPATLSRAFAIFNGARPRPVHIEIPIDVITAPADHVDRKLGALPSRPAPCPDAIARAVSILNSAQRPLLLLGGGTCDAGDAARGLAEALDAPTACTINAKGVLPKGHPLSLGSNQSLPPVRELSLNSDVVLAIGTELGETDYDVVFDGNFHIAGTLIRIDIDPEQLNRNFAADVAILSDARMAMTALLAGLGNRTKYSSASPGTRRAADVRARLEAQWPASWSGQRRTLEILQESLPDVIVARRLDSARLFRQSSVRGQPSALLVQFRDGLRHAGLRIAGSHRRQAGCAGPPGGCLGRRRWIAIYPARVGLSRRGQDSHHRSAVEQPRLWRNKTLHAEPQHSRHWRRHLHTGFPRSRRGLRLPRRARGQFRAFAPIAAVRRRVRPASGD